MSKRTVHEFPFPEMLKDSARYIVSNHNDSTGIKARNSRIRKALTIAGKEFDPEFDRLLTTDEGFWFHVDAPVKYYRKEKVSDNWRLVRDLLQDTKATMPEDEREREIFATGYSYGQVYANQALAAENERLQKKLNAKVRLVEAYRELARAIEARKE